MYISFSKVLKKHGLTPQSFMLLQCIHQNKGQDNEEFIAMLYEDDSIIKFSEKGWIHQIKGKKTDSELAKLRTTKKGRDLLINLQKDEDYEEQDKVLAEWIEGVYASRPNYIKSNKEELKRRLCWFRYETGIHKNELGSLLKIFIMNSYVDDPDDKRPFSERFREFKNDNPRAVISNKTENIIWTPPDRYSKYYSLEHSPLWNFYKDNEEYVEKMWQKNSEK